MQWYEPISFHLRGGGRRILLRRFVLFVSIAAFLVGLVIWDGPEGRMGVAIATMLFASLVLTLSVDFKDSSQSERSTSTVVPRQPEAREAEHATAAATGDSQSRESSLSGSPR